MSQTIMPTHECFDDAVEIVAALVEENRRVMITAEYMIVHAIVAPYGEDMAHAWVESKDTCRFIGLLDGERVLVEYDRAMFYDQMHVKDQTRYTILEACQAEQRTGRCGPWEEKYQRITRDFSQAAAEELRATAEKEVPA